ncbi:MAG: alpha/beta hydrolase [Desulfobacteraceae bacterium]|nr:alpha/beta hydrolase [Desulfobacteraceae bacterium]
MCIAVCAFVFAIGCGHPVFYQPRPYSAEQITVFKEQPGAVELTYETSQGVQTAFYLPGKANLGRMPDQIWVIFSGVSSLALDWLPWLGDSPDDRMGFYLIDYPGYGNSDGVARAKRILESSNKALAALSAWLKVDRSLVERNMGILGHSLGTGTALQFSVETGAKKIILVSPFTDFKDLVRYRYGRFTGGFLNLINPEVYANRERLDELAAKPDPPEIIIFHGDKDMVIPVEMGRELAGRHPSITTYKELENFGHRDFFSTHMGKIFKAMAPEIK